MPNSRCSGMRTVVLLTLMLALLPVDNAQFTWGTSQAAFRQVCSKQDAICCLGSTPMPATASLKRVNGFTQPGSEPCSRILSNGYFKGSSSLADNHLMAALVADVYSLNSKLSTPLKVQQCQLRQKWAALGADFASIHFYDVHSEAIVKGRGAVFAAGADVFAVFDSPTPAAWPIPVETSVYLLAGTSRASGGARMLVSTFFWDYYQLFVAQGLIRDITAAATSGISSARRIYLAGFSGGSAVSVLAALELGTSRVGNVYLFGHEKLGNAAFYEALTAAFPTVTSWWNGKDWLVPYPPPSAGASAQVPMWQGGYSSDYDFLSARFWWRIAHSSMFDLPLRNRGINCFKIMYANSEWFDPCPQSPADANNVLCLNPTKDGNFHDMAKYKEGIEVCWKANASMQQCMEQAADWI